MKKKVIILLVTFSLIIISFLFQNTTNEKTINIDSILNKIELRNVQINKTTIKENLNQFYFDDSSIEIERLDNDILYGSLMDDNFITIGLWEYNLVNQSFNYYKYNMNDRIWSYFIDTDDIYYISTQIDNTNGLFHWKLIKSKFDFSNRIEIDSGIIYNDSNMPFFIQDYITHKVLLYSSKDEIEVDDSLKIKQYLSKYTISIFDNNEFLTLIEGNGDHINKNGIFSFNAFSNINFYNNKIIYCDVSYFDKEVIKLYDLQNNQEKVLFENNDLNNWSLSITKCNKDNCILSFDNKIISEKNRLINISLNKNEINIINSNGQKRPEIINKDNFIIFTNDAFILFSSKENKIIEKLNLINNSYVNFISNNDNIILIEDINSDIYIVKLK